MTLMVIIRYYNHQKNFIDFADDCIAGNAIDFVQLPSRLRGIPMRQWRLIFDFNVRDFSMDPSQDLLVIIEASEINNWVYV